ncbi:MBOAT family protein [Dasania sp. GY-MA-18]|uniref:Probable alginate O-acetylase n=1 Tax=Dasania phycosphaerae TaxID=2950436 RepID=A0A9J6RQW8_9GAMM|nr:MULTISPECIES: MBOAT family O-acyltransferase [Dasania]MCR8924116.1 MBOAT family protein [Dasania sp. GY-MA-18]MCZ0866689.1 MBOAT family protein [Dasania phycosphaerae]MCZ0870274.1 MBOAT family protein [Dasania phycosphaerae]
MTFNSINFALFLPIFLILFYSTYKQERLRDIILLIGSYIFYMFWYWQYAALIALSTIVDFHIGKRLDSEKQQNRLALLITSLTVNLGILATFKYYNFFYESSQLALGLFGIFIPDLYHQLLLPVGISFYTFQTLSYTIDIYRKKISHEPSFTKFAVFVSFFPQLVAGPIVRAKDFLPQINSPITINSKDWELGFQMIFLGLFKKIIIADLLAYLAVDAVFDNPSTFSSFDLLMGIYAYSFQIYCDFSGYSDIAIGIALLLGLKLPINFNRPYLAQSPSDFWKRWHISLSGWLRDYLYISLGGNKGSRFFTYRNLMITMLLGGLWHGAAFNFLLWGAFHGLILILTRNAIIEQSFNLKMIGKIIINFHLIAFSWLLFRVSDINTFNEYIGGLSELSLTSSLSPLFYLVLSTAIIAHVIPRNFIERITTKDFIALPTLFKSSVYAGLLLLFVGASIGTPTFIYFQF